MKKFFTKNKRLEMISDLCAILESENFEESSLSLAIVVATSKDSDYGTICTHMEEISDIISIIGLLSYKENSDSDIIEVLKSVAHETSSGVLYNYIKKYI